MKPSPLYSAAARVFFKNEIEQHLCEPVCGCHGKKKKKITKQTNKNALVEEEEDKLEIIHGRDVFHVLLRRASLRPQSSSLWRLYTYILLRLSLILCLTWLKTKKKGMLDALCAHSQKSTTNTCRSSLYTSTTIPFVIIRLFTFFRFVFFNLRRRCVAYLPSFISDSTSPPALKRIYNFDLSWWRLHFQPLAGGEKRPAAHSIILRHPPKANPRLTLSLCNFVRPPSAFYQVITLPWSKNLSIQCSLISVSRCLLSSICFFSLSLLQTI